MLLRGTAAVAERLSAAQRKLTPACASALPRVYATHSGSARLRVAPASAVVHAAAGVDNAAQAQAWIDAWRAKQR